MSGIRRPSGQALDHKSTRRSVPRTRTPRAPSRSKFAASSCRRRCIRRSSRTATCARPRRCRSSSPKTSACAMRAANSCSRRTPTTCGARRWRPSCSSAATTAKTPSTPPACASTPRCPSGRRTPRPRSPRSSSGAHDDASRERVRADAAAPAQAFEQAAAAFGRLCGTATTERRDPRLLGLSRGRFRARGARSGRRCSLSRGAVELWDRQRDPVQVLRRRPAQRVLLPPCTVVHQFHEIRVNQNAVRVVDSNAVCEQLKAAPGAAIHVAARAHEWGRLRRWSTDTASVSVDR